MMSEGPPTESDDTPTTTPADVFGALSDPLRIDILHALVEYHRKTSPETQIGFADLRRRVGVEDSGRFRYHVEQLRGNFVEKGDEGYRLTYAGAKIVAAILMGTYTDEVTKKAEPLDSTCFICDTPAVATYQDGSCLVSCANDHPLFAWQVPPTAAADMTLPELVDVAEVLARQGIERALIGICPECYHTIDTEVRLDETAQPLFHAECESCSARVLTPVGYCLLVNPHVAAFYRRHGRDLRGTYTWELPFVRDETLLTVIEESPVRVEIDVCLEDDRLSVTVNETGHVIDHQRSTG